MWTTMEPMQVSAHPDIPSSGLLVLTCLQVVSYTLVRPQHRPVSFPSLLNATKPPPSPAKPQDGGQKGELILVPISEVRFAHNNQSEHFAHADGDLIPGTWYREPFWHKMVPYQTLRPHTLCTQLLVTFHVFFISLNPENHKNRSQNARDMLF